jgi:hypothetical protein
MLDMLDRHIGTPAWKALDVDLMVVDEATRAEVEASTLFAWHVRGSATGAIPKPYRVVSVLGEPVVAEPGRFMQVEDAIPWLERVFKNAQEPAGAPQPLPAPLAPQPSPAPPAPQPSPAPPTLAAELHPPTFFENPRRAPCHSNGAQGGNEAPPAASPAAAAAAGATSPAERAVELD